MCLSGSEAHQWEWQEKELFETENPFSDITESEGLMRQSKVSEGRNSFQTLHFISNESGRFVSAYVLKTTGI